MSSNTLWSKSHSELWLEAHSLYQTLIHLSMEADQVYLEQIFSNSQAKRARRLHRVMLRAGKRSLRRLKVLVEERDHIMWVYGSGAMY
jgi:hypothetical protein